MNVFLSHAVQDRDLAEKIAQVLRDAGFTVRDPVNEIFPGDNWAEKIALALRESEAMVVLLTPDALASDSVRWDIGYALGDVRFRDRLIPVFTGPVEDVGDVPWILKRLKKVRLTEDDSRGPQRIAQLLQAAA